MGNYLDTVEGKREAHERARRIKLYDAYYEGEPYRDRREWRNLLNYIADIEPPSIVVNYPRLIVERPTHFAFDRVRGVAAKDASLQDFVSKIVQSNDLIRRLGEISVEASICGDCLLSFDFNSNETVNPFPIKLTRADDYTVEYDPLDPARVSFYRIERRYIDDDGKEKRIREELHSDKFVRYEATNVRPRGLWGSGNLLQYLGVVSDEPLEWRIVSLTKNRFGFLPTVLVKNRGRSGTAYGESDLSDLLTIFDDINWKLSQRSRNISRTMNAILKNVNGRILNDYVNEDAVLNVIGENAQVGYLVNDADMSQISTHLSELRRALSEVSGVTMLDPEKFTGFGVMSGFALSVLYEPLMALAESKRRAIGGAVERLLSLIVKAAMTFGIVEGEPADCGVSIVYGPMMRSSESELFDRQSRLLTAMEAGVVTKDYVERTIENE